MMGVRELQLHIFRPAPLSMALALVLASARASALAPSPPHTADPLRVSIDPAIDDAALIPGWITDRNAGALERLAEAEGHEQWIDVIIGGSTYDYRVTVTPMRDGAPLGPRPHPVTCECRSERLLELVDDRIAAAAEQLRANPVRQAPAKVEPPPALTPAPLPPEPSPPPPRERRRISGLGISGIAIATLGAGAIGGGVAMLAVNPRALEGRGSTVRNWSERSRVALAGGGTVLAVGVTMLVVDAIQCAKPDVPRRCERRRASSKEFTLDIGPSLQAGSGGITVHGRF